MVDSEILNRLFMKAKGKEPAKKISETKPGGKTVLDAKRSQNVCIALARLKFPPAVIAQKLFVLDQDGLGSDELAKIESVCVLPEEDRNFETYFRDGEQHCNRDFAFWSFVCLIKDFNFCLYCHLSVEASLPFCCLLSF